MILFTKLRGFELRTAKNEHVGKIKDLVVRRSNWEIKGFLFSEGIFEGENFFPAELIKRVDYSEKAVLCYGVCKEEKLCDQLVPEEDICFSELLSQKAFSEDNFEIGIIYDGVIYVHLSPWSLEKILIDRGLMKRRSRISTGLISHITDENDVFLSLKHLDVDVEERNELERLGTQKTETQDEQKIVEKKLAELSETISKIEIKLEAFNIKSQTQEENIEEREEAKKEIKRQLRTTKRSIKSFEKEVSKIEEEVQSLGKEIPITKSVAEADKKVKTKLRDLKKQKKEREEELTRVKKCLDDDIKRKESFEAHIKKLDDEQKELEKENEDTKEVIKAMTHDFKERKREKNKLTRDFKKLEKKISKIEEQIKEITTPDIGAEE